MRILITGGAGFIASHLYEVLGAEHDVWGFDNFLTGQNNYHEISEVDITDRGSVYRLANDHKPEVVIHCAASYNDPDKWHRDTQINVEGGINAALVAKHHNAHLIYFQTILPPVSSYAISKIAAEQYMRLSGVDLTVLRLANIYGPRNLSGPIPVFHRRIDEGLPCVVVDTTRDMVYIADLVRAVQQVVTERLTGTFDVCSGIQTPIMDLFQEVRRHFTGEEIPPLIPPDPDDVQGVVSLSNRPPGWSAETSLRDGIRNAVWYYRENTVTQTYTHLRIGEKDAS